MNITTHPVSFLPTSAAQPTDVLRRDNQMRESIAQVQSNEASKRGQGADSERTRQPGGGESYANQLASARAEAGFPFAAFGQRIEDEAGDRQQQQQQQQQSNAQSEQTLVIRSVDDYYEASEIRLSYGGSGIEASVDDVFLARGERIERFYEGSYRPKDSWLIGVA